MTKSPIHFKFSDFTPIMFPLVSYLIFGLMGAFQDISHKVPGSCKTPTR